MTEQEKTTQVNSESEQVPTKPSRGRMAGDSQFPRNSLKDALQLSMGVWKENAGEPFDPILLAQVLKTTRRSSKFTTLIASSSRYGLTEGGEFAKSISLTKLGKSIVAPTDENMLGSSLRKALLTPKVFTQIYSKYDRKNIPREEIVKSVLERDCGIPRSHIKACYNVIMKNISEYNLSIKSGDSELLYLDNIGKENVSVNTGESEQEQEFEESRSEQIDYEEPQTQEIEKQVPKVFISYSKNENILDQLKTILEFGGFECTIAEEVETVSIPIPDKIFGLMRECNCAIINVSADEEMKQENDSYRINENVLIEIGAAFVHYDKRVILLVDKRLELPSNLQGLYRCEYEGDGLSFTVAMKLQKALTEFKKSF